MGFSATDAAAINQAQLAMDVSIAVAKKTQNHVKQQGEAALALLETAAEIQAGPTDPAKGRLVDLLS